MKIMSISFINKVSIFTICVICLLTLVSCNTSDDNTEGGYTYPPSTTVVATPTVNNEVTPSPTAKPTAKPLSDDQKGIPQEDSEVLYSDTFDNDVINNDAITSNEEGYEIVNGLLKFKEDDWYTYAPDIYCEVGTEYNQYEYYVDISAYYGASPNPDGGPTYMTCIVGVRVDTADGTTIPTGDSGYWIAISHSKEIIVYPTGGASEGYWPGGAFFAKVDEGFINMKKLLIVDSGDQLFYYIISNEGERSLFLHVVITSSEIMSYDKDGNLLHTANNHFTNNGGYFKLFNHYGVTTIDNVTIKASN